MPQCENGKVGIPFADHTTAGELAARYSTVSLNSDVVPGSESITGAIYGGQQQFAALAVSCYPSDWLRFIPQFQYMAAVHIQYMDVNKLNRRARSKPVSASRHSRWEPGLLGDDRLTVDISVRSTSSRLPAVNRKFLNRDDALVDVVDAAVGADFGKDLAHRG